MINPPKNYSEWVDVIEILKSAKNDEEVALAMQQGVLDWQESVAERFMTRFLKTIELRINLASEKFQQAYSHSRGNEGSIVMALISLRKNLSFIYNIANLKVIPEEIRKQCVNIVVEQANNMQSSLEKSAKNDRTGKLSSIVRNHQVNKL